jgi:hypothetical protein
MKKSFIALFGAIALSVALPVIAQTQTAPSAQPADTTTMQPKTAIASKDCKARKLALPLDHGPRAETTPRANQQRKERFEARMKACKDAAG